MESLTLVTWNILCASSPEDWERRRGLVVDALRWMDPDVAGLQEVLPGPRRDLERAFPEYRFLGGGRDPDGQGEGVPLMVRLPVLDWGEFWLSETPREKGLRGWDAFYPRHCTWARLANGLSILNTHLDHLGARARLESVELLIRALAGPRVLLGDFNEAEDGPAVQRLEGALVDAWRRVHPVRPAPPTWHDFGRASMRLDYVFTTPDLAILEAEVVSFEPWPSDHHPVQVRLRVP